MQKEAVMCSRCHKAPAEINNGDDGLGEPVCCNCYVAGHGGDVIEFNRTTIAAAKEMILSLTLQLTAANTKLSKINRWADTYGESLKPTAGSADTFGDGMRAAKAQIKNLVCAPNKLADTENNVMRPDGRPTSVPNNVVPIKPKVKCPTCRCMIIPGMACQCCAMSEMLKGLDEEDELS